MQTQAVTKQMVLTDLTNRLQQVQFDRKFNYVLSNYTELTPYMRDKLASELIEVGYNLIKGLQYASIFKTSVKSDYLIPVLKGNKIGGYYRLQFDNISKISYYQANVFTRLEFDLGSKRSSVANNQPYQRLNGLKTFMDRFNSLG